LVGHAATISAGEWVTASVPDYSKTHRPWLARPDRDRTPSAVRAGISYALTVGGQTAMALVHRLEPIDAVLLSHGQHAGL